MPVRIHGRLLAELGAVLGFCLAAAGCQTSAVRYDQAPLASTDGYERPSHTVLCSYLRGESSETMPAPQGRPLP